MHLLVWVIIIFAASFFYCIAKYSRRWPIGRNTLNCLNKCFMYLCKGHLVWYIVFKLAHAVGMQHSKRPYRLKRKMLNTRPCEFPYECQKVCSVIRSNLAVFGKNAENNRDWLSILTPITDIPEKELISYGLTQGGKRVRVTWDTKPGFIATSYL